MRVGEERCDKLKNDDFQFKPRISSHTYRDKPQY
jgi:hypothetical protein